mmetsp:Transcript_29284/g.85419  ORF Transcript_29284/g.85419 Transcript_29284/m.85419 type:complete len:401 (-) Transcript_29284:43-1245(-)
MEASTTMVNMNPESIDKLMGFIGEVAGEALEVPKDVASFVALMVKHTDKLISSAEESDAEGCFQILFHKIQATQDPAMVAQLVGQITAVVSADPESKPALRLRIMANLYNVLSTSSGQAGSAKVFVDVLLSIIAYAVRTGQLTLLQGYLDLLDDLVAKWGLGLEDQRRLFLQVAEALEESEPAKSQQFLLKYLVSLNGVEVPPSEKTHVAKAVVAAIRDPIVCFMERQHILGMTAVAQLEADPSLGKLYALLKIFSQGKLRDFLAFAEANAGLLEQHGLVHSDCVGSMRLLSLCSLATEHEEIPYTEIAKDLDVPLEEVEHWVVKTITAKLIDAKMDQLEQRVMISRCAHRMFESAQWSELKEKLDMWKTNLRGILETIQRTQAMQQQQAAAAAASMSHA